ncbi:radical SAM protein [Candidatus Bathyarchaeota archaeon]|nr:radical SAM protein [Candidatus Bathyarchaeota archaeon]
MVTLHAGPYRRVLLISPAGPSGLSFALHPIPLAIECIAGAIRDVVHDVMIYDQFADKSPLLPVLKEFKPDLVGVSMSATEHNSGKEAMAIVKKFDPRIPIIAGGYHPTGAPEIVLEEMQCDAVCRGEGENVMVSLVEGKDWKEIEGLSFRDREHGGIITHNPDQSVPVDLDALPFPARDLRKRRGYKYENKLLLHRQYDLMYFSRGCYGKCSFCCEPYFSGSKQRYRSPERTMEEIREIWEFHGAKPLRILISDPNIMAQPKKVDRLCEMLLEADLDVNFQVMTRTELIVRHPDLVEKMVRAGMISWELGIESPVQNDLDSTLKYIPLEKQENAVGILRDLGAEVLGTYVVGLPEHTKSFVKTFPNHARKIGCSAAAFGIATPFPGSVYWDELESENAIFENNWAKFDENNCVITHPLMSPSEIENLRSWCMGKFWNLDTVLEQIRRDHVRVGKFRKKTKTTLAEFFTMVGRKLGFAVSAGSELAEKGLKTQKENYMGSVKSMFDAWADSRVENYFDKYPMHEIIDMRQFGRKFKGKRLQIVLFEPATKACIFAMLVTISSKGIDKIRTSKKPSPEHDLLVQADINALYVPPNLGIWAQVRNIAKVFSNGQVHIKGHWLLFRLVIYVMKELISLRILNSGT